MPVSRDIVRTYRGPRRVVGELMSMGQREDRAIMWLMIGCLLYFLSLLPIAQRDLVMGEAPLGMPGISDFEQATTTLLFSTLMVLPLMFYAVALVAFGITRALRSGATAYGARVAIFWGWLAATPLALFFGLLVGFNGIEHPGSVLIGAVWLAVLAWFWISGLAETSKET
ncbi:MAG: hypothetical protein AAGL89_07375 [Pseudomonadota bacterium]